MEDAIENPDLENPALEENSPPPQKKTLVITDNWNGFMKWANEEFRYINFGYESSHWAVTDLSDNVAVLAHPIGPFLSPSMIRAIPARTLSTTPYFPTSRFFPTTLRARKENFWRPHNGDLSEQGRYRGRGSGAQPGRRPRIPLAIPLAAARQYEACPQISRRGRPGSSFPIYPPEVYDALYQAALTRNTIDRLITHNAEPGSSTGAGRVDLRESGPDERPWLHSEKEEEIARFCSSEKLDVYMEIKAEDGTYVGQWIIGPEHPARDEIAKSRGFPEV